MLRLLRACCSFSTRRLIVYMQIVWLPWDVTGLWVDVTGLGWRCTVCLCWVRTDLDISVKWDPGVQ